MDRLDELTVLITILDEGSLSAASRRLRRSPPAITRILAALEQRVGARLFERTTRRLAPTEAGRQLALRGRVLLSDYASALKEFDSAPVRGLVRVAAPVQFGRLHMAAIVSGFLNAYADVRVELLLDDRYMDLIDEGVDVALRIGALPDSGLMAHTVGQVGRVLVASPEYLQRHGTPERPAALAKHAIIFGTVHQRPAEWRFGASERGPVVRFTPKLAVNEVETQLIACRAGRGIARLLSYQVAADLAAGSLVRLLRDFEPQADPVQLVTPSPRVAPKVRAFLAHAGAQLQTLEVLQAPRPGMDGG